MSLILDAKTRYQQSGIRGVMASALRLAATRISPKSQSKEPHEQSVNEFLAWVRFAVPGMLCQGNIDAMEYAIANMPSGKPIVEIGSFCGLSTVVMSYLQEKYGKTSALFTCDKWEFEGQKLGTLLGDSRSVTHDVYREYVKGTFQRSMQTFAGNNLPHTIECFSDEFFQRWFAKEAAVDIFNRPTTLGGEIGFCYIDGNHTYEFAKRDFENTHRALVPGGFILFDDSADGSNWEVNQLTREIAAGQEYELVSKAPNYLFRKQ